MYWQKAYETGREAIRGIAVRKKHILRGSEEVRLQYGSIVIPKDSVFYVPNSEYLIENAAMCGDPYLSVHTRRHTMRTVKNLLSYISSRTILIKRRASENIQSLESLVDGNNNARLLLKKDHLTHIGSKGNGRLYLLGVIDHFEIWKPEVITRIVEQNSLEESEASDILASIGY